jgi:hypothetical protein
VWADAVKWLDDSSMCEERTMTIAAAEGWKAMWRRALQVVWAGVLVLGATM